MGVDQRNRKKCRSTMGYEQRGGRAHRFLFAVVDSGLLASFIAMKKGGRQMCSHPPVPRFES
jgi:hypothetical protein